MSRSAARALGLAVLGLALSLAACKDQGTSKAEEPPRPVRSQKVELREIGLNDQYAGEVRSRTETSLAFRVGGKIVAREVEVGTRIQKGQVLARLDAADLRLQSDAARSQVAAAQADHEQARADLERYRRLRETNVVSQAEIDRRQNNFNALAARLEQARSNQRVAENQLAYAALVSDGDGVVTQVAGEVGQVVAAGQTVLKVARTDEKDIVINVPENRLDEVKGASGIRITLWAQPELAYRGQIREISPGVEAVTRTYTVKIAVTDNAPQMQLGMTANVVIHRAMAGRIAVLPLTALYQKDGKPGLWVVDPASGAVALRAVEVAAFHEQIVLIAGGVKDGEIVVTAGVHKLDPGQKVRLLAEAARK
ncbi:MAG: efflux RND transporter periplasmic adaptor subunit [Alphaproteobacteria bacterium]|nr:efflux RND transporter periplasmic adaptor subunit [Alphaproteobacteria bacterium]